MKKSFFWWSLSFRMIQLGRGIKRQKIKGQMSPDWLKITSWYSLDEIKTMSIIFYSNFQQCDPPLPKSMHNHSLWKNWDTIIDTALTKLQEFYIISQQHGPNGIRPEIELIERNKTIGRFDFYNQWLRSFENWLNSEFIKIFLNKKIYFFRQF